MKQLVTLMGGTIEVQSELGKGTSFRVCFHFQEVKGEDGEAEAAKAMPESIGVDQLEGRKVLLCEDNAMNREIATALLKSKGLIVATAENGQVGVDAFSVSAPFEYAAILMDIRMPVMDGFDATRTIRALDREDAGTIPIIAMTADAFEDDIRNCLDAGMNAHVSKPIDPDAMFATLSDEITESGI